MTPATAGSAWPRRPDHDELGPSGRWRHWTIRTPIPARRTTRSPASGPSTPIGILRVDRADGRPPAVVYNFAGDPYLVCAGGDGRLSGAPPRRRPKTTLDGAMALFLEGAVRHHRDSKDVNRPRIPSRWARRWLSARSPRRHRDRRRPAQRRAPGTCRCRDGPIVPSGSRSSAEQAQAPIAVQTRSSTICSGRWTFSSCLIWTSWWQSTPSRYLQAQLQEEMMVDTENKAKYRRSNPAVSARWGRSWPNRGQDRHARAKHRQSTTNREAIVATEARGMIGDCAS